MRANLYSLPQYTPTPGNFGHTPSSPSKLSLINANPPSPLQDPAPHSNWVEGKVYNKDPPTCIHYWIEWKVTLNTRTVIKDTEQNLVLAPGFYWRLFLQPKLREKLCHKFPHRKIILDDTSIVMSVSWLDKVDRQFSKSDINWPEIEKQLSEWGSHFLAGKRLKLIIARRLNYY
ncbi:uncharacterized protein BDW70DRAFT_148555 [Aspergillus foveolatus]|uniref:uncharacterized protein n=1 Tax=Aspergillus foveolatus TaxID=210207 RepID=UPI003CCD2D69